MSVNTNCPACKKGTIMFKNDLSCECSQCRFQCHRKQLDSIVAAMEFAEATRALEDAMEPLNSGKLKMGQALPAIRLAMEVQKICEIRVLGVFRRK